MKLNAEIQDIRKETHDVKTFKLDPEKKVKFTPGQYCLVSIVDSEEEERKPFTYASSPTKNYVELTVKKIGEFTTSLHNLEVGNKLELDGPRGESLNFDETVEEDVVFLAGGSGITPFMSAMRYALDKDLENEMTLIFSNRTERDIIFEEELNKIDKRKGFKVVKTLTNHWPGGWEGETGLIDSAMINKYVENLGEKIWYICGPPPMIDSMNEILEKLGISQRRVMYEKWMIPGKGN